jgi:Leucine-rich repeat (LRR) protein
MTLTEDQIHRGFWWWDPDHHWPPEAVTDLDEYVPSARLNLVITQLNRSSYQQKKLVEAWCDRLPALNEVRYLWFCSRVNQRMFDAACRMPKLEGLYVKWSGIKSIVALREAPQLKHLHIGSSAQLESVDVLSEMTSLITLSLEQLNKVTDFKPLVVLTQLEGLELDGSMWTTQVIDDLRPLKAMTKLKYLTLANVRVIDQSFKPLDDLPSLIRFHGPHSLGGSYDHEESKRGTKPAGIRSIARKFFRAT